MQLDKRSRLAVFVSIALALFLSEAAVADGITTTISGFGTVGGSITSNSAYAYEHDGSEFVGASNELDIGLDSRIGVQARFDFGSGFSVTAQEVARLRGDTQFDPGTEWLYIQYSPTSDWKLRLGRVALGTFLISDSREVGYAQPWFRSPNEVYGAEPFYYLDGGQVLWNHNVGQTTLSLQSSYGKTQQTLIESGLPLVITAHYVYNLSAQVQYDNVTVRVAQTTLNNPITLPLSATDSLTYSVTDKFTSVGVQYDNGKAIAISEWTKRTENVGPGLPVPLAGSSSWYVAGGWRFNKLTPMVIYGVFKPVDSLISPAGDFGSWSGSLRYDIVSNVALKAQVSRPQAGNGLYWVQDNTASTARVNVYSVGADFVF